MNVSSQIKVDKLVHLCAISIMLCPSNLTSIFCQLEERFIHDQTPRKM